MSHETATDDVTKPIRRETDIHETPNAPGPNSEEERVGTFTSGLNGSNQETRKAGAPETAQPDQEFTVRVSGQDQTEYRVASGSTLADALPTSLVSGSTLRDPHGTVVSKDCKVTDDIELTAVPKVPAG